jgi:ComF family protein
MSFIDTMLAKIAPHDCLGCGAEGRLLCRKCQASLPPAPRLSSVEGADLDAVSAAVIYQGIAKNLVWKLKSSGAQAAAVVMAEIMLPLIKNHKRVTLVSVPTATSRVRQRGYDQSRLLGRALARQAGLPWMNCLARIGQTHQVGANREQRRQQLHDAFRVAQKRLVTGKHLILVDDVVTTGSTLEAAAKILKEAGAIRVDALTFAYAKLK